MQPILCFNLKPRRIALIVKTLFFFASWRLSVRQFLQLTAPNLIQPDANSFDIRVFIEFLLKRASGLESIGRITRHAAFRWITLSFVFVNAILIGVEIQNPSLLIQRIQAGFLCFFVVEIILRYLGERNFRAFFRNPWNVFDFTLVCIGFLPPSGAFDPQTLLAFRTLRILRVLRLLRSVNDVKVTVMVLIKSLKALTATAFLLLVFMYLFALIGMQLFQNQSEFRNPPISPDPYGTVPESMFTLLRIMSGEDWTDVRYGLMESREGRFAVDTYHVTWMVLSSFLLLNLIVGAIVSNFEQVKRTETRKGRDDRNILDRLSKLRDEMAQIERDLQDSYTMTPKTNGKPSDEILARPVLLATAAPEDN